MRKRILSAAAALAFTTAATAQTKWDMPTPYVDSEFHTQNIRLLADEIKKVTNGQLEIIVHSGQSLIKHPDILRAVSTGQVAIGEFLLGQFSNEDPMFEIDNIPFVAVGYEQARKFYGHHRPYLEKRLQGRKLRLLYSIAWPGQGVYTKTALKSVDDLKGTKFRTYSAATARLAELLGASPTVIQATDIPQAFATNTVHAMITSSATGVAFKSWEYTKFYYLTAAMHPRNVVAVNEAAFQRLPETTRKALLDLSATAETRGWTMSQEREGLGNKMLADNGINVVEPDTGMKAAFSKIGATMLVEWTKKAGPDGEALIKAYRAN
ncbi:MAG: C4-dicarboxylate ABC transporter substrate-binding protein [Betaproteobacteria bacterium]|nr:C4-dicarboxylate ABC transporter substrate-binding protein [Betaproteobacteria bacterium]